MADRREPTSVQHRSPSFSQTAPRLASTSSAPAPSRLPAKRSVSGSANLGSFATLTAVASPVQTPAETSSSLAQSHSQSTSNAAASLSQQQRAASASSTYFGMSKLDQATWSDAPVNANGSPSSVWTGRAPSTMDGDAVTTATASNVSTPSRGPTALDAKDSAANAPVFMPSPLLPQEGSAWSIGRTASLSWANPAEIVPDTIASSPSAVKRVTTNVSPSSTSKTGTTAAAAGDNATASSPTSANKTAAPVPKRAPIRSVTLDPSQLASNRRLSGDVDESLSPVQAERAEDQELVNEINTLTISTDEAPSSAGASIQQHGLPSGYSSPPAFMGVGHHAHRPSGSFPPPPFSPGEAFMHPSAYLPASGARSPDGYAPGYPGVAHMMPGMPPIDMSGYESYRTTPDPYAPTMPGRAIFASPGSQGSTPQSPSFGPTPLGMRNGEAMFYPGVVPGFGPPPIAGGMASPVRPMMPPGTPQYAFGAGVDGRNSQLGQSPMIAPGMPMPMGGLMMPPTSPALNNAPMPGGPDSRSSPSLSQSSPYAPGPHRRMASNAEFGPGMAMSPRPPFAMPSQAPFVPAAMMGGAPMPPPAMMGWNGRFHDHRRVPTGPGGVMPAAGGYGPLARYPPPMQNAGGHPTSSSSSHSRSPLLEEFRSRPAKNRKFELADIYGSVVEFSCDQHGSRFIQEKLDSATPEEKARLFDEMLPHARQLMTDVFGNYVIQKMLEHGSDEQRDALARQMEEHVLSLSLGTYGCRVVQKAFDHVSAEQLEKLARELDGHVLQCVRDQNANHVVQKVIERVKPDAIQFIPAAFTGQVAGLASHCYSCRVLQRTFEYCSETQVRPLLDELRAECLSLMQHQYGNYVIQWVLQRGQAADRDAVMAAIERQVVVLSMHKFASNVIEQVVRTCDAARFKAMVGEILEDGGVVKMMKDQYGNYVVQRFVERVEGEERDKLIRTIRDALGAGVRTKQLIAIERLIDSLSTPPQSTTT